MSKRIKEQLGRMAIPTTEQTVANGQCWFTGLAASCTKEQNWEIVRTFVKTKNAKRMTIRLCDTCRTWFVSDPFRAELIVSQTQLPGAKA